MPIWDKLQRKEPVSEPAIEFIGGERSTRMEPAGPGDQAEFAKRVCRHMGDRYKGPLMPQVTASGPMMLIGGEKDWYMAVPGGSSTLVYDGEHSQLLAEIEGLAYPGISVGVAPPRAEVEAPAPVAAAEPEEDGSATFLQLQDRYVAAFEAGDLTTAASTAEEMLRLVRRDLDPGDPLVGLSLYSLANAIMRQGEGRHGQALELFDQAAGIWGALPDEQNRYRMTAALNNAALIRAGRGEWAEARAAFTRVLAVRRELFGDDHPEVAAAEQNLATLERDAAAHPS